jgi:hypothetical protein
VRKVPPTVFFSQTCVVVLFPLHSLQIKPNSNLPPRRPIMVSSPPTLESRAIWTSINENRVLPDFPAEHIPTLAEHFEVHEQLRELLTARVRTEVALEDMLSDRASDGSPLDPNRDYEDDFNRLSQQYEDLNCYSAAAATAVLACIQHADSSS